MDISTIVLSIHYAVIKKADIKMLQTSIPTFGIHAQAALYYIGGKNVGALGATDGCSAGRHTNSY